MKFGISLILVLTTWNLFAKVTLKDVNALGLVHFQQIELAEEPYSVLVYQSKGNQIIQLHSEKKLIFEKKVNEVTDGFQKIRFKLFPNAELPFALIFQQKGVHGEQFSIVSLQDGKEVFHVTSAWPLEFEDAKDQIKVHVVDEDKKTTIKTWKP